MEKPKLWTKDFLIDAIVNFFTYLAFNLLAATIVVYAMDNLKASPSKAGLSSGIFVLGALISRIFAGRVIDGGRKKLFMPD
jgi:MFS family permease